MITQAASQSFAEVHDRMPLSLNAEQVARLMNPEEDVKKSPTGFVWAIRRASMAPGRWARE